MKKKPASQPKRLNQSSIAKALGVSRATVSLVLRGGEGAADSTKAKVLEMAEKMGYRPNALVHSIRSGKSRTVGVLAPPHDLYWRNVCYGIHDRLIESDHLPLFLWDTDHHEQPQEEYALGQIHRLLDRWVDGVILWPYFAIYYAMHLHEFESRNIPLVIIDHTVPELNADTVESNEASLAQQVIGHLRELGHRHFLIVSGPESIGWADNRTNNLAAEINKDPSATYSVVRIAAGPFGADPNIIREFLRANPHVTAVAAGTDECALITYKAAAELGWPIPGRLSVVGVGNLNESSVVTPPLTTIDQNGYALGQKAAQIELERSAGILSQATKKFTVPVKLVIRQSTGLAPQR